MAHPKVFTPEEMSVLAFLNVIAIEPAPAPIASHRCSCPLAGIRRDPQTQACPRWLRLPAVNADKQQACEAGFDYHIS